MKHLLKFVCICLSIVVMENKLQAQATNKIDTIGNVGIGTITPGNKLDINVGSVAGGKLQVYGTSSPTIQIQAQNNPLVSNWSNDDAASYFGTVSNYPLVLKTHNMERMRLNANGNIGIGTTTPGNKLDINVGSVAGGKLQVYGTSSPTIQIQAQNNPLVSNWSNDDAASYFGTVSNYPLILKTHDMERMRLNADGNVGIGTVTPSEKLSVNGNISTKKLIVTQTGWSDYVFDKTYQLRSLTSLEQYINQHKHLPEIPSAKEVEEKGISVGDNQALLLKKIEELTLYIIELNKTNAIMKNEIGELKNLINRK